MFMFFMLKNTTPQKVGAYLVTPLTKVLQSGQVDAAVSIRRGMYDRIFRFVAQFPNEDMANHYALSQGRSMVLNKQLS